MRQALLVLFFIVGAFLAGNALSKPKECGAACGPQIITIKATEFAQALNQAGTLIDVRTPEEYAQGHLANAVNADFNHQTQFEAYLDTLDKDKPYLIYCRSGNRSGQALKLMEAKGFTHVINLDGGIQSWQAAGYTLEN